MRSLKRTVALNCFAQSVSRVCGCDVRSPATVRHPLVPRVQDAPAHQAAFACVRPSVTEGASSLQKWRTTIDCHRPDCHRHYGG